MNGNRSTKSSNHTTFTLQTSLSFLLERLPFPSFKHLFFNAPAKLLFTHCADTGTARKADSAACLLLVPTHCDRSCCRSVKCCVLRCPQGWFHAGLYDCWKDGEESEPMHTCTILTTDASKNFHTLHDRMPVILASKEACTEWMSSSWETLSENNWARYNSLCMPYSGTDLVWFPVTTKVRGSVNLVIMTKMFSLNEA
jgi:hypothetical protein